jgi:hypothetical protein
VSNSWFAHASHRLAQAQFGDTYEIKNIAELQAYGQMIAREFWHAVIRRGPANPGEGILIATPPRTPNESIAQLRVADEHPYGPRVNYFDPKHQNPVELPFYAFPMLILDGPPLRKSDQVPNRRRQEKKDENE